MYNTLSGLRCLGGRTINQVKTILKLEDGNIYKKNFNQRHQEDETHKELGTSGSTDQNSKPVLSA